MVLLIKGHISTLIGVVCSDAKWLFTVTSGRDDENQAKLTILFFLNNCAKTML